MCQSRREGRKSLKKPQEKLLVIPKQWKKPKQRHGLETLYISQHGDLPTDLNERFNKPGIFVNDRNSLAERLLKRIYFYESEVRA